MASSQEQDLPLALRRSRRKSQGPRTSPSSSSPGSSHNNTGLTRPLSRSSFPSNTATPRKGCRGRKRVRFSDPGVRLGSPNPEEDELSTGLTPMIRRTALGDRPKRRHSTPGRPPRSTSRDSHSFADLDSPSTPCSGEVSFLPLRQVLDGRIKRRIRRNGLSEEMNTIFAERRRRAKETKAELDRLRTSVEEKDREIRRLQDGATTLDVEAVSSLEREIEALKKELSDRSGRTRDGARSPSYDWTLAARDPFSDDFMDMDTSNDTHDANDTNDVNDPNDAGHDDTEFGHSTMAEITCSTPVRKDSGTFLTPPESSPASMPVTPCYHRTPHSDTGVQACLPDPDKQELEDELATLQLEVCKLTRTLESYSALAERLSKKLGPFSQDPSDLAAKATQDSAGTPQPDLEARLGHVLQTLSDRTAALLHLNSSLSDLGFPGSDASEMATSLSNAFRAARLELEYLTPGEVSLPLSTAGAAVLDMVLTRLRDLAKRSREADDTIDEYQALEHSLRQQLEARVEAMDGLAREKDDLAAQLADRDARIAGLELGLDHLKGAAESYTRDVSELEALVQRAEADLAASRADRDRDAHAHADELGAKTRAVAELQDALAAAAEKTAALQMQMEALQAAHAEVLSQMQAAHAAETEALRETHREELAARDGRVAELRGEVERVSGELREAHEAIRLLRVEGTQLRLEGEELRAENAGLAAEMEEDHHRARGAVASMRTELEKVVRMSEGLLATPRKPRGAWKPRGISEDDRRRDSALGVGDDADEISLVGTPAPSDATIKSEREREGKGKGKAMKRRRYDSGLGFLDEEEEGFGGVRAGS